MYSVYSGPMGPGSHAQLLTRSLCSPEAVAFCRQVLHSCKCEVVHSVAVLCLLSVRVTRMHLRMPCSTAASCHSVTGISATANVSVWWYVSRLLGVRRCVS